MAFDFNKLKDDIFAAGKEVGDKVNEASSVAKKKYEIHNKEALLEKQFAELGRKYYYEHKIQEFEDQSDFADIAATEAEINILKEELLTLQGAVECPSCGLKQSKENSFCSSCGTSLSKFDED